MSPRTERRPAPVAIALLALAIGIALVAVALAAARPAATASATAARHADESRRAVGSGLKSFRSCPQLGGYARAHREALMPSLPVGGITDDGAIAGGAESAAPSASEPAPSSTNIQEQGVDEPDIVKASGATIFAIVDERLEAVDAGAGGPEVVGSIHLPSGPGAAYGYGHQLLLVGDRALVISTSELDRAPWTRTVISEIEIADPAAMSAVRTLSFEGSYVSARQTGGIVRVVTSTTPNYPIAIAEPGPIGAPEAIEGPMPTASPRPSRVRAWLPQARLRDHSTGERSRSPLVRCGEIRKPRRFSGLEMLSVLTIDLKRGLEPVDADAVMTGGEIVYGSPQALYVATERWLDPADAGAQVSQVSTAIHKFDVTDPGATKYVATGKVPGFMLSQWSLSEHEGLLRVASTTAPPWDESGQVAKTESFVSVLGESGDRLVEVGRVGGLGHDEQIYAVRFIGEVGYVVTFRQVDPLYTIDLSDPADPRVLGELEVPGYSAYLHPVGPGRLLGIGQDADSQGRTRGVQASLFDVSDLTTPARLDSFGFGPNSYTEVEYDHHAFFYSEPQRLVVVPLETSSDTGEHQGGAAAFRIDPEAGIETPVQLSHGSSWRSTIRRSLVVGERLFTVSARGVMAHDLETLVSEGWAEFGPA